MWLSILAIVLLLAFLVMHPLADGLMDTSAWAAKIFVDESLSDMPQIPMLLRGHRAALMDGWLSNVPFISTTCMFSSVVAAFFAHWWLGITVILAIAIGGFLVRQFFGRTAGTYLMMIYGKMANRVANYRRDGDADRLAAGEEYLEKLRGLLILYAEPRIRPPTPKQLKSCPYGNASWWLEFPGDRSA